MKPHALVPYPMTPPDDPPEPCVMLCTCGSTSQWYERIGYPWRVCVACSCGEKAPSSFNRTGADENWNAMIDEQNREEGESRKAEGQARVALKNEAWMIDAQELIRSFAKSHFTFTVQDVRTCQAAAWIGEPAHPNAWGAAFSVAAKQGLIVRVGYQKNKLASAHSRVVATWRGAK